jgi:hemolysin III
VVERSVIRLSGTEVCPRWRGWIHLGALIVAVPAAVALVVRRPAPDIDVYAVGLVLMFAGSSGYHLLPVSARGRRRLRQADHAVIYIFIAASYTPFCWLAVPHSIGVPLLACVWTGAVVGVVLKTAGFDRVRRAGGVLYMVMGWLAVLAAPDALRSLDTTEVALVAATGASYFVGTMALFTRRPDPIPDRFGYHEVWHSAVVVAAGCYFAFVWQLSR